MSFKGKVVIVTGASSGIGAATAIKLSAEGANVVLVARNEAKLADIAKKCENPLTIHADVSKDEDVQKIIDETIKKFGQIDVLVNNAGTGLGTNGLTGGVNMKGYDQIMSVNLRSAVHLTGLAVPYLIKSKGNIINISSVAGKMPHSNPAFMFYSISKAGMDHFTVCAAAELGKHGVRVNTISPGPVFTDFLDNSDLNFKWDDTKHMTLLNRVSQPGEVADLVMFLASDKAVAITGSDFVTDNGALVNRFSS